MPEDISCGISTEEIVNMVSQQFHRNRNSVIPSDHCYNYTNQSIDSDKTEKFFMRIDFGRYEYVGEDYNYQGIIMDAKPHIKKQNRMLLAGAPEMTFHTISDALNYCFGAGIDYIYQKGYYPAKKDLWKYYMAWFPNFVYYMEGELQPGSKALQSNWFNEINEDESEIIEYNYGVPKEKYEPEKNFYRLVFGRRRKEDYKFLGIYRMMAPYKDGINYAYRKYERVTDRFDTATLFKEPKFQIETEYIDKVKDISSISETEKRILTKSRIGQGLYRENLINKHDEKCMLCGLMYKELLIASHIKEWSNATNEERMDVNNGLLLCALHDSLFDKHLISFDKKGKIVISSKLNKKDCALCNISENSQIEITPEMEVYMTYHRDVFLKNNK